MQTREEFFEERARLICGLAATKTVQEISIECRIGELTIRNILHKHGFKAVRKTYTRSNSQEERNRSWIAAYEAGESNASEIARANGVSRERVCQILRPMRVIEKRIERQRLVNEALAEESVRLKQETKERLALKLAPALELVRGGQSIRSAGLSLGFSQSEINILGDKCRAEGIKTVHGRHRDMSERLIRCEALFASGLSVAQIVEKMRTDGDPTIHPNWFYSNLPHLRTIKKAPS